MTPPTRPFQLNRRQAIQLASSLGFMAALPTVNIAQAADSYRPRYLLASCMYGYQPLENILPEVERTGAEAIDLWPMVHGNQREQVDDMGLDRFEELLQRHSTRVGCITQYKLGPFGLRDELRFAERLGCSTIVTGAEGPKGLSGEELKMAVGAFIERLKPHLELAGECGVTLAIENHANNLIESPDSLRYLAELAPPQLGIAFAPYHLPQDETQQARLLRDVAEKLTVFYAWEHGDGCMKPLPTAALQKQLPGRGSFDFAPLLDVLESTGYTGWTEIFMHPFPRGISIDASVAQVTRRINEARDYLESVQSPSS